MNILLTKLIRWHKENLCGHIWVFVWLRAHYEYCSYSFNRSPAVIPYLVLNVWDVGLLKNKHVTFNIWGANLGPYLTPSFILCERTLYMVSSYIRMILPQARERKLHYLTWYIVPFTCSFLCHPISQFLYENSLYCPHMICSNIVLLNVLCKNAILNFFVAPQ